MNLQPRIKELLYHRGIQTEEEIEEFLFAEEGYLDELPVKDSLLEAMMQKVLFTRVMYARTLHTTSVFVELEKKEQKYIQCWHGTPLKRLGCDLEHFNNAMNTVSEIRKRYHIEERWESPPTLFQHIFQS